MPRVNRNQIIMQDMYDWYKSLYKNHVDHATYRKVTDLWGEYARELLLEGKDLNLYVNFPLIGIRKRSKPVYIDRILSKKLKKKVYSPNTHSDYYGAFVYWRKNWANFNTVRWTFLPARKLSRGLAQVLKQPGGHRRFVENALSSGSAASQVKINKRYKL